MEKDDRVGCCGKLDVDHLEEKAEETIPNVRRFVGVVGFTAAPPPPTAIATRLGVCPGAVGCRIPPVTS